MPTFTHTDAAELFRNPPERFLDVGEGEVAYRRVGTGPDVLFVHGWPFSGATFRLLLPHLAEHVTCHLIDFPGAGSSRFDDSTKLSFDQHIESLRRVVDLLGLESLAAVGHDSGGLIARHALAGDPRLRGMGLLNTEQSTGLTWQLRLFVASRHLPGFGPVLGAIARQPWKHVRLPSIQGDFEEFTLQPLYTSARHRDAATRLLRSFDKQRVLELESVHRRIDAPVRLVWGDSDPFFPIGWAHEMVETFPNAELKVIEGAGLMVHEQRPAEVAQALLPVLQEQD